MSDPAPESGFDAIRVVRVVAIVSGIAFIALIIYALARP